MSRIELLNQLLQLTVWLPINDFSNYKISLDGIVKNIKTNRILKSYANDRGYHCIELYKDNKYKSFKIHRLVATHFIPNLTEYNYIDHIDNDKNNNKFSNLRYCSPSQNQYNRKLNKNNKSSIKGVRFENNKWRAVICFNKKQIHIGYYDNLEDAKIARQQKAAELFGQFLNECEK
jgi:hypothetical protein